jgi:polyisoprenoid-binding protein YceI
MRRFILLLFISLILPAMTYAKEVYQFDPDHTYALWFVSHFGFSSLSGKFMAEGRLVLDENNPQNSNATVIIHTDTISTGMMNFDNMLKGPKFFNTKQYPKATFVSQKIHVLSKDTVRVYGVLTIKGISKHVRLFIRLNREGIHPYYRKKAIGLSGGTQIKRTDFDIDAYGPGVGNDVKIDIQAELLKK